MQLKNLKLLHRGKVRDIYELPNLNWLIVATDRLSAYDVVLPTEIPKRGIILTQMSNYWMNRFEDIVPNHLVDWRLAHENGADDEEMRWLEGRCVEVKRLIPLKVEAIARGFLSGSAWTQYNDTGEVNGIPLPPGLQLSQKLSQPIYTPSTKDVHDENISFQETIDRRLLTAGQAERIRRLTLELYYEGAKHTSSRGILCADTKFEFGVDPENRDEIYLMDEVLTPDSSRFWSVMDYQMGSNPPSFDKQIVRDYLDSIGWNRQEPAPELPDEIVEQVVNRYFEASKVIIGDF